MLRSTHYIQCFLKGDYSRRGLGVNLRKLRRYTSSIDHQRRRENSARLRALRKPQRSPVVIENDPGGAKMDYRYEEGATSTGDTSRQKMRKSASPRKFVPFFEEIDVFMEERTRKMEKPRSTTPHDSLQTPTHSFRSEVEESTSTSLKSVFDSLGDPPTQTHRKEGHLDLKTLLRTLEADSQADGNTELKMASSSPLESVENPSGGGNREKGASSSELNSFLHSLDNKHKGSNTELTDSSVSSILNNLSAAEKHDSAALSATEPRSIFDAFPAPAPPRPRSPDAFDEESHRDYIVLLDNVLMSKRFGRRHTNSPLSEDMLQSVEEWLRLDEKAVDYDLPIFDAAMDDGATVLEKGRNTRFRHELENQKKAFMENRQWNEQQYDAAKWALIRVGHQCARIARSLPLDISWEKIKEAGMALDNDSLNSYLYSCTTYTGGKSRRHGFLGPIAGANSSIFDILGHRTGSHEEDENADGSEMDNDGVDLPEELATFHDLLHAPTEQSLSIRVRALVAKGDAKGAEKLLDTFSSEHGDLRHRTYIPVLRLHLEQGDIPSALKVFRTMRDKPSVILEPETYVQVISALAENGYFSPDSEPITGADDLGYSAAFGPKLFDHIASEMAEDVLEITSASARRLYAAFESAYKGEEMGKHLVEIHSLAPLAPMNDPASNSELIVSRVAVDSSTGICPRSGAKLRLINLEGDQRKQLRSSLLELSKTSFVEFKQQFKHKRGLDDDYAAKALCSFSSWLDEREGEPFTAIVDGANVAYYMQNFHQGKFNLHQIQFMVDTLEKMNENPLVVMPFKYKQSSFKVVKGSSYSTQVLDEREHAILDDLTDRGKLYIVPKLCLDDYYWMLASVSDQTKSRNGLDLSVSPGNEEGRWAGTRPMLVTNDQMRDHKLELLEPRLFRRWYSCYIVNYNFTAFVDDECVDDEIGFCPADFFSREIQGNATPGDGATAWHFPVSDWELHERFCIRIPHF